MGLIECRNICKNFGEKVALDNVSVDIPAGKIFGLLGPNGAGKTTLIRIVNRITIPNSGEVIFDGRPITQRDVERIGYLPEERGLYRKMEVGDQAMYLAQLKGMSARDAQRELKKWFVKFGIQDWWKKKVEELSKGMAQKVQFITTVVHKPALMILDEPFSGFDPVNAELLKREILALRDKGHTILFSTHNMASVEEMCDHVALINHSRIVLQGAVDDIRERYKDYTYSVEVAPDAQLDGQIDIVKTEEGPKRKVLIVHKPQDETNASLLSRIAAQTEVYAFSEILPSMNDIFIRAVQNDELH